MDYHIKYETSALAYGDGGGRPAIVIDPDKVYYKYSRNSSASSYGLVTYNSTGASIAVASYDIYYPVTTALPQVNTVRVYVNSFDVDTGLIEAKTSSAQLFSLTRSDDMDDSLPETITVDGTIFYRHHMVPPAGNDYTIPMGWCAQVFHGHNYDDYDDWDDVSNKIYPLCTSSTGVASSDGTNIYTGIVTKSSTVSYVRRNAGVIFRRNYEETMTYSADPPVFPNVEDRWCVPTATHDGIDSRFNIFPYIHMNGLHL